MEKINVLGINGSASQDSSNLTILKNIKALGRDHFDMTILEDLSILPHFQAEQSTKDTPPKVIEFRTQIERSDGVIIVTPEYVFSIPSRLKNAIEWCVSETVFSDKPIGLITASASGEKGHEELKLLMKTLLTNFTDETSLLIKGVKGKTNLAGEIIDSTTLSALKRFVRSFTSLLRKTEDQVF